MTASIVITTYNHERYVDAAIRSAIEQTVPAEVIVVDDGSTDRSVDVLNQWASTAIVLHQPNRGQASALNAGISRATSDVVLLLDGDDWCHPHRVERTIAALAHGEALCLRHDMTEIDEFGRQLSEAKYRFDVRSSPLSELERFSRATGSTSGFAFHRAFLQRLGPIPDEYRINPDWYVMAAGVLAGDCVTLTDSLTFRRFHSAQASQQRSGDRERRLWSLSERFRMARDAERLAQRFRPTSPLSRGNTWWQRKAAFDAKKAGIVRGSSIRDWLLEMTLLPGSALPLPRLLAEVVRATALGIVPRRLFGAAWWATHHGRPRTRLERRLTTQELAARRDRSGTRKQAHLP